MEFSFECECDEALSDFTRGSASEVHSKVECTACGAVYTLTVTQIRAPSEPSP